MKKAFFCLALAFSPFSSANNLKECKDKLLAMGRFMQMQGSTNYLKNQSGDVAKKVLDEIRKDLRAEIKAHGVKWEVYSIARHEFESDCSNYYQACSIPIDRYFRASQEYGTMSASTRLTNARLDSSQSTPHYRISSQELGKLNLMGKLGYESRECMNQTGKSPGPPPGDQTN